jgi:hypothetical protein
MDEILTVRHGRTNGERLNSAIVVHASEIGHSWSSSITDV